MEHWARMLGEDIYDFPADWVEALSRVFLDIELMSQLEATRDLAGSNWRMLLRKVRLVLGLTAPVLRAKLLELR